MRVLSTTLAGALAFGSLSLPELAAAHMVDGDCSEYSKILAEYPDGITADHHEDVDSVWLCFTLSEGSSPTGEFILSTPKLDNPIVLHVSAQLGEWPFGDKEAEPKVATSTSGGTTRDGLRLSRDLTVWKKSMEKSALAF